mmetsp:Transcript_78786/g.231152  ORF Transcript_78786/g.231152 Transcript_78786/m.231152 type:complete len:247 (-) Transcript_78786:44-784(-)
MPATCWGPTGCALMSPGCGSAKPASRALEVGVGAQWARPGGPSWMPARSVRPACSSTPRGMGCPTARSSGDCGGGRACCGGGRARGGGAASDDCGDHCGLCPAHKLGLRGSRTEKIEELVLERAGELSSVTWEPVVFSLVESSAALKSCMGRKGTKLGTADGDCRSMFWEFGEEGTKAEFRLMNFRAAAAAGDGSGSGEAATTRVGEAIGERGVVVLVGTTLAATPGRVKIGFATGVCGASSNLLL